MAGVAGEHRVGGLLQGGVPRVRQQLGRPQHEHLQAGSMII